MTAGALPIRSVHPGSALYPNSLRELADPECSPVLRCLGQLELLRMPLLGLLSAADTPPDLFLPAVDLASALREARVGMVGGFQSTVERLVLDVLLTGEGPLMIAPARGLEHWHPPADIDGRLRQENALVISRFGPEERRPSVRLAALRNALVCALADRLFVIHASSASRTMRAAAAIIEAGKPLYCFDHPRNRDLLLLGAWPVDPPGRSRRGRNRMIRLVAPASR